MLHWFQNNILFDSNQNSYTIKNTYHNSSNFVISRIWVFMCKQVVQEGIHWWRYKYISIITQQNGDISNDIRNIYQLFFDGIPFSWNDLITCNTYNIICYLIMKITLLGILYCGFALWRGIYFYFTLNRFEALVMHFLSANVKIIFMTFTISSFWVA